MSGTKHSLELVLQNYLGSDSAALNHLSEILLVLGEPGVVDTATSGVLGKWNARINNLLHSREASSRWVGLVLAKHTAVASRNVLIDSAQGWVGVVLPMLSKAEPFPNHHAAIRLLACLFTNVTDMPEFVRQVVVPNVQKCSLALLALAKSEESGLDLKILAIDTLTQFTTHHPTHHRALQQNIHAFTLEHLQGSFPIPTLPSLLQDSSTTSLLSSIIHLHATLPLTGGKVGASIAWRKSVDLAMGTIWNLLGVLRRTYGGIAMPATVPPSFALAALPEDPTAATPLALDRLRCMVRLLAHLLSTPTARPISMPLGSLSQLSLRLLQCTSAEVAQTQTSQIPFESVQRTVEAAAAPELCAAGCMLIQQLARTCTKHLTSYVPRFLNAISYQLDQPNLSSAQRACLFKAIPPLLSYTHMPAQSQSNARLASHLLKALAPLLPTSSGTPSSKEKEKAERKGKKRSRYEADELFSFSSTISTSADLCTLALSALHSLALTLPLGLQSTIQRTLLTILLHVPRTHPINRSLPDHLASVYTSLLSDGGATSGILGISVQVIQSASCASGSEGLRTLHRLLHPRIPPTAGSGPSIDDLALFWKDDEEGEDDETREFRQGAGVVSANEANRGITNEVQMTDVLATAPEVSQPAPVIAQRTALPEFAPPSLPQSVASSIFQSTPTPAASVSFGGPSTSPPAHLSQLDSTFSSTNLGSETSKAASSSFFSAPVSGSSHPPGPSVALGVSASVRSPLPIYDDDEEPIPEIDLASDTDEDET